MSLREGSFYWKQTNQFSTSIFRKNEEKSTDIVVVGAGISAALVSLELIEKGYNIIVIDENRPTFGSTKASTAIIQYDTDLLLCELSEKIGLQAAKHVYAEGIEAIKYIKSLSNLLDDDFEFQERPSLLLANNYEEVKTMIKEKNARDEIGLDVEILQSDEVSNSYPFICLAALKSTPAAELNPVSLTESIFKYVVKKGGEIIPNCKFLNKTIQADKKVQIDLDTNRKIVASKVIFCCGYKTGKVLGLNNLGTLHSSYAGCSNVLKDDLAGWKDHAVIWEVSKPYHYFRRTQDRRIIIGGRDKKFKNTFIRDLSLPYEKMRLRNKLRGIAKNKTICFDYFWTGTFGESEDSLPFIGELPGDRNSFVVLGTGGNGITFSVFAKKLVGEWLGGGKSELSKICSLTR